MPTSLVPIFFGLLGGMWFLLLSITSTLRDIKRLLEDQQRTRE